MGARAGLAMGVRVVEGMGGITVGGKGSAEYSTLAEVLVCGIRKALRHLTQIRPEQETKAPYCFLVFVGDRGPPAMIIVYEPTRSQASRRKVKSADAKSSTMATQSPAVVEEAKAEVGN